MFFCLCLGALSIQRPIARKGQRRAHQFGIVIARLKLIRAEKATSMPWRTSRCSNGSRKGGRPRRRKAGAVVSRHRYSIFLFRFRTRMMRTETLCFPVFATKEQYGIPVFPHTTSFAIWRMDFRESGTGAFFERRAGPRPRQVQGQVPRMPCGCLPDESSVQYGVLSWPPRFDGKTGKKRPLVVT